MATTDLHERLARAVRDWHGSERGQRAFQRAMEAYSEGRVGEGGRAIPGVSRPMLHQYLKGKATPPLEFVEAAAQVLGVPFEWLAIGKESPTAGSEPNRVTAMRDALAEEFAGFSDLDACVQRYLLTVVYGAAKAIGEPSAAPGVARQFGAALQAPLDLLDTSHSMLRRMGGHDPYATAMCQALSVLVRARRPRPARLRQPHAAAAK